MLKYDLMMRMMMTHDDSWWFWAYKKALAMSTTCTERVGVPLVSNPAVLPKLLVVSNRFLPQLMGPATHRQWLPCPGCDETHGVKLHLSEWLDIIVFSKWTWIVIGCYRYMQAWDSEQSEAPLHGYRLYQELISNCSFHHTWRFSSYTRSRGPWFYKHALWLLEPALVS